jgi:hypothetical protein
MVVSGVPFVANVTSTSHGIRLRVFHLPSRKRSN